MVRKIQTSINLSPEMKNIVDTEGLNLSKFVEDQLEVYFSVSTIEAVNEKIMTKKAEILALEGKRADLLMAGEAVKTDDSAKTGALEELKHAYLYRRNEAVNPEDDHMWITGPKKLCLCKTLEKDPNDVLDDLKRWYDGLQKNKH